MCRLGVRLPPRHLATGSSAESDAYTRQVQQFVYQLDALDGLAANVDSLGQLRITALGDRRFDFSNRVQPVGDLEDTFGSTSATITS